MLVLPCGRAEICPASPRVGWHKVGQLKSRSIWEERGPAGWLAFPRAAAEAALWAAGCLAWRWPQFLCCQPAGAGAAAGRGAAGLPRRRLLLQLVPAGSHLGRSAARPGEGSALTPLPSGRQHRARRSSRAPLRPRRCPPELPSALQGRRAGCPPAAAPVVGKELPFSLRDPRALHVAL